MNDVNVDDLTELYRVGAVNLPQVAVQYSSMAQYLHKTALSETAAFTRSVGGLGPLYSAWTELRNLTQEAVAVRSHENLVSAGTALTLIAESFANSDHLTAEEINEFEEFTEDLDTPEHTDPETGETVGRPDYERPPYVPDAPGPDDPHPEETNPNDPFN